MIIECIACSKKFELKDELLPPEGSKVRCGACGEVWFFHPEKTLEEKENSDQDMSFLSNTDSELEKLQSPIEKEDQDINDDPDSKNEINKDEVSNFKIFGNDTTELPEKEQMDRETSGSVTTVIQDNKQVTNSTQNTTEQTPGLAATESDYTARALSALSYRGYAGGF